jgi:transcriptional regulator with XRE-family HTH domain
MNIGNIISQLRDKNGFSQSDLADKSQVSRVMIGKYERGEVKPTVDVIKKLAEVLETTISFMMGETESQNVFKDPVMFKRMAEIENLPQRDKECLLLTVDNFIKATKLNML